MIIKTEKYEWSHGSRPRGRGYWCLTVVDRFGAKDMLWLNGKLSEIIKHLKTLKTKLVVIEP